MIAISLLAIIWDNVDPNLFCHMASLSHNELNYGVKVLMNMIADDLGVILVPSHQLKNIMISHKTLLGGDYSRQFKSKARSVIARVGELAETPLAPARLVMAWPLASPGHQQTGY